MYVCMHLRMYVCTLVRMYVYVCMHVCVYVCWYACMYVYIREHVWHRRNVQAELEKLAAAMELQVCPQF